MCIFELKSEVDFRFAAKTSYGLHAAISATLTSTLPIFLFVQPTSNPFKIPHTHGNSLHFNIEQFTHIPLVLKSRPESFPDKLVEWAGL